MTETSARRLGTIASTMLALLAVGAISMPAAAQVATLSSPAPEASEAPDAAPESEQDGLLAWAACMRENGVEMDDPQFGLDGEIVGGLGKGGEGSTVDAKSDTYIAASEACVGLLASLKPPLDQQQQAELAEQQLAWAACMREQGIDLPDPDPDGSFSDYGWKVDLKGDAFLDADAVCSSLFGGGK